MISVLQAVIPDPDPLPLPAPAGLLWFLLVFTFLLHVLPMNLVLGGSVIGSITERLGRKENRPHHRLLAQRLAKVMPAAVAFTITLGVAPLLFLQVLYGRLFFTSSILMAGPWLAIVPLLIVAYYGVYYRAFRWERLGGWGSLVGWMSTLLFMTIGFLFTNNMTLMLRPERFRERYLAGHGTYLLNLDDPTVYPRFLHFFVGAIAVSGMMIVVLGLLRRRREPEFAKWAIRYGSSWFAYPTALNMAIGVWWFLALPEQAMLRFLGGDPFATAVFAIGVALALVVLMLMLMASQSTNPVPQATAGAILLLFLLIAMILNRDQVRRGALEAIGFEPTHWVATQWGPILLFLVLLAGAIATIWWMVAALSRKAGSPSG